jgi:hypothetical protein
MQTVASDSSNTRMIARRDRDNEWYFAYATA